MLLFTSFGRFNNFIVIMAHISGLNILALVLASWIARTSFALGFDCGSFGQAETVTAYEFLNTTVTSPNYPSNYDNNLDCRLLIKVDESLLFGGYIVKVVFNDFTLGFFSTGDVLKFYDGMNAVSSLLGSYSRTTHPEVIYSTGRYLFVKFLTDSIFIYRGFSFTVSAVKEEEASGICNPPYGSKVNQLQGSSGTFFTPGYPVPYPNQSTCLWIITVPSRKKVELKFEDFDLESVSSSCKQPTNANVYVQIRNGQDQESKELVPHCGYYTSSHHPDVYSSGRYMWVKFYSNSQNSLAKGFKAHFEAVDFPPSFKEMCFVGNGYNNNLTLSGLYGTLQSPRYPKQYPPGLNCDWVITVPEGKIVMLRFNKFKLGRSFEYTCTADYVEILDGKSTDSKSKGKFCGYTKPEDIRSSDRFMLVRFRADFSSDPYYSIGGFNATFTAEDKPWSTSTLIPLIIGIVAGGVVLIGLVCCIVCIAKRKKTPSRASGVGMPMTGTTSGSLTTQTGVIQHPRPNPIQQPASNPYPTPPVGYVPAPSNPSCPPPAYQYPSEPPPPYPGKETVPQYPPPGQPYPWLQSATPSPPPQSP